MANPFLGEIRIWPATFAPQGWAFCNGQLLLIAQNSALFNLIGSVYGGDGKATFALPDLRSRAPLHHNKVYPRGTQGGVENVTLTVNSLPAHQHAVQTTAKGATASVPSNTRILADEAMSIDAGAFTYLPYANNLQTPLAPQSVGPAGGSQPHANIQPFLALMFIIALQGVAPPIP